MHRDTERDIEAEYRTEVAELLSRMQPTFSLWRERGDNALLAAAAQALPAMIVGLAAGVGAQWVALLKGDARAVGRAAQRAVQPAGTAFIRAAWQMQGHASVPVDPERRPCCPECGRKMRIVRSRQSRHLVGRLGTYELTRPCYGCPAGHGSCCAGDEAWGLGAGTLDPDLLEVVARDGVESDFEQVRAAVARHPQVAVDDNTVERVTVGMGHVLRKQNAQRATEGSRSLRPDPGSDVVLLEADGGRVHAGGEWREVKVAVAGPLGPAKVVDKVSACTDVTGFGLLGHLREMAEQSGVGARVAFGRVPVLPGAWDLLREGAVSQGTQNNYRMLRDEVRWHPSVSSEARTLLCDAQTSGGLLIAVPADRVETLLATLATGRVIAADIGEVLPGPGGGIEVVP